MVKVGEDLLRKSWFVFWFALAGAAVAGGLMFFFVGGIVRLSAAILYGLFIIWWTFYYYKLVYLADNNTLSIKSGAIFRRHKILNFNRILWTMRVTIPFKQIAVLTVLHTSNGSLVIFGDFLTGC